MTSLCASWIPAFAGMTGPGEIVVLSVPSGFIGVTGAGAIVVCNASNLIHGYDWTGRYLRL